MGSLLLLGLVQVTLGFMLGFLVGILTGRPMDFRPYPKMGKRVVSKRAMSWVMNERDGGCMYGFWRKVACPTHALHVHHIQKRSQLGPDDPTNLITLCAFHHDQAERHIIKPDDLIAILIESGAMKEVMPDEEG